MLITFPRLLSYRVLLSGLGPRFILNLSSGSFDWILCVLPFVEEGRILGPAHDGGKVGVWPLPSPLLVTLYF